LLLRILLLRFAGQLFEFWKRLLARNKLALDSLTRRHSTLLLAYVLRLKTAVHLRGYDALLPRARARDRTRKKLCGADWQIRSDLFTFLARKLWLLWQ